VVKPEFAFFQVEAKHIPVVDVTETCKPRFGEGPRAFEPVDARAPAGKLVVAVLDPEVFSAFRIHQAVITALAI